MVTDIERRLYCRVAMLAGSRVLRCIVHATGSAEMARRNRPPIRADIFKERRYPTWLVAEDPWQRILESRLLPVGTDLMRVYLSELLRHHDAGWYLSEFQSFSASFCEMKEHELKRYVYMSLVDPTAVTAKGLKIGVVAVLSER